MPSTLSVSAKIHRYSDSSSSDPSDDDVIGPSGASQTAQAMPVMDDGSSDDSEEEGEEEDNHEVKAIAVDFEVDASNIKSLKMFDDTLTPAQEMQAKVDREGAEAYFKVFVEERFGIIISQPNNPTLAAMALLGAKRAKEFMAMDSRGFLAVDDGLLVKTFAFTSSLGDVALEDTDDEFLSKLSDVMLDDTGIGDRTLQYFDKALVISIASSPKPLQEAWSNFADGTIDRLVLGAAFDAVPAASGSNAVGLYPRRPRLSQSASVKKLKTSKSLNKPYFGNAKHVGRRQYDHRLKGVNRKIHEAMEAGVTFDEKLMTSFGIAGLHYVPTLFLCATEAAHIGAAGLTHADGWNVNWLDYAPARAPPARLDDKTYVDMLVRIRKALHHELEISKREFVGGKALKLPPFKWGNYYEPGWKDGRAFFKRFTTLVKGGRGGKVGPGEVTYQMVRRDLLTRVPVVGNDKKVKLASRFPELREVQNEFPIPDTAFFPPTWGNDYGKVNFQLPSWLAFSNDSPSTNIPAATASLATTSTSVPAAPSPVPTNIAGVTEMMRALSLSVIEARGDSNNR